MTPRRLHSPQLRRLYAFCALLLAVAWVPLTSHELLESAGWIHQDAADSDHGPAHEAADGLCRLHDGGVFLKAPALFSDGWIATVTEFSVSSLFLERVVASSLRRATESPPGLARTWQFVLRLALPGRAPSFQN